MGFYREGKPVKVGDKTYPSMSAWSRACGLSMGCLIYRLSKGMTPEEAEDPKDHRELTTGHKIPHVDLGKKKDKLPSKTRQLQYPPPVWTWKNSA